MGWGVRKFLVVGLMFVALVAGAVVLVMSGGQPDKPLKLVAVPSGAHCLDKSTGGLHATLWEAVRQTLDDPGSATDKRMSIDMIAPNGTNAIHFTFRAKDRSGRLQRHGVEAHVRNVNCQLTDWKPA